MTGIANSRPRSDEGGASARRLLGRTPSSLTRGLTFQVLRRSGRRRVVTLVTAPPAAVEALLRAPAAARRHPRAREVQALLREGWVVDHVALSTTPVRACVRLRAGDETCEIGDNDPAFAAFAATLLARRGPGPRGAGSRSESEAAGLAAARASAGR